MVDRNPIIIDFAWDSTSAYLTVHFSNSQVAVLYAPMVYDSAKKELITYPRKKHEGYVTIKNEPLLEICYNQPIFNLYKHPFKVMDNKDYLFYDDFLVFPGPLSHLLTENLLEQLQKF